MEVLKCPNCGGPLPIEAAGGTVTCAYCNHVVTGVPAAAWGTGSVLDTGTGDPSDARRPRAWVGAHRYVILGRLARGTASDVFLARRDARLTEQVVIHIVRAIADGETLARAWRTLEALHESSTQGAEYFTLLLPQPVALGPLTRDGRDPRPAAVYRWRSGFVHTLADVARAYPDGVDPRAAVWMWRRALEVLGWGHRSGYAHGAVLPEHLLVHPRDHGVVLVGWSHAERHAERHGGASRATPAADITAATRTLVGVLGGDPERATLPTAVPGPLADLLVTHADPGARQGRTDDAWELMERVASAARTAYGPPTYLPFTMPA